MIDDPLAELVELFRRSANNDVNGMGSIAKASELMARELSKKRTEFSLAKSRVEGKLKRGTRRTQGNPV